MQTLLSYIIYSERDTKETVYKLPKSILTLVGMPSPVAATFTGVYGRRGHAKFIAHLYKVLDLEDDQEICPVDVTFDVSINATHYNGLSDADVIVTESKALNTLRLRADLGHEIRQIWSEVNETAGKAAEVESKFPTQGTARPDYIDALRAPRNFPHLDLIIYNALTPAGQLSIASSYIEPVSISPWLELPGKIEF
mgnify:CR=1 FL=1